MGTKRKVLSFIGFFLVLIGFIISLFASASVTMENGSIKFDNIVWGVTGGTYTTESLFSDGTSHAWVQTANSFSMMAIGAILAVLASAILLVLVINSDKQFFAFIALFILIGAIMMFCFKNYAYQAVNSYSSALGVSVSKIKGASSGGCVVSGIAMIGGAIFQGIASFLDSY